MAFLFDALFDTVDEGQEARPRKLLKSKIQTLRVSAGLDTTNMNWFLKVRRPPSEPIRLGSDLAGYGIEILACN